MTDRGRIDSGILSSWKEIAAYLKCSVRSVQRFEQEYALPIHRMRKGPRSPVFAFPSELSQWLASRPGRANGHALVAHSGPGAWTHLDTPRLNDALRVQAELIEEMKESLKALRSNANVSRVAQREWIAWTNENKNSRFQDPLVRRNIVAG
jgi:hypothetical protein